MRLCPSLICRDGDGEGAAGLVVTAGVAGTGGATGGCTRRCFSVTGTTRGKRSRNSLLSWFMTAAGGATLGGVCLTTGIRVSRSGFIRGLPSDTATETDGAVEGA